MKTSQLIKDYEVYLSDLTTDSSPFQETALAFLRNVDGTFPFKRLLEKVRDMSGTSKKRLQYFKDYLEFYGYETIEIENDLIPVSKLEHWVVERYFKSQYPDPNEPAPLSYTQHVNLFFKHLLIMKSSVEYVLARYDDKNGPVTFARMIQDCLIWIVGSQESDIVEWRTKELDGIDINFFINSLVAKKEKKNIQPDALSQEEIRTIFSVQPNERDKTLLSFILYLELSFKDTMSILRRDIGPQVDSVSIGQKKISLGRAEPYLKDYLVKWNPRPRDPLFAEANQKDITKAVKRALVAIGKDDNMDIAKLREAFRLGTSNNNIQIG